MATMVNELLGRQAATSLSEAQVTCLARTFRRAAAAVWIDDAAGRCVYRSAKAGGGSDVEAGSARFDVSDHTGRVVARLHVAGQ